MSMVGGPIEEKFPNMLETPLAVQQYSDDYLAKDPYTCEYFMGGYRKRNCNRTAFFLEFATI